MARKLIVGLGNPGKEYAETRHNAGFQVADSLLEPAFPPLFPGDSDWHQAGAAIKAVLGTICGAQFKVVKEHRAAIAVIPAINLLIAKPLTYMNESGQAVQAILHYFKIALSDLLVVHDDVSLPLGRLRLQGGGGAGGQHGVESIIKYLGGDKSFDRLKVGVGPDPGGERRAQFVLSSVAQEDKELYRKVIGCAGFACASWLTLGLKESMNAFNGVILGLPQSMKSTIEEREEREGLHVEN